MYRIGKLHTVEGCKMRLPCPLSPLLEVARLTGDDDWLETGLPTMSWPAVVISHPALLMFCVDRFLHQHQQPPTDLEQLSDWAKHNLAMALLQTNAIKPIKRKKDKSKGTLESILKQWRSADSVCDRNRALYLMLKEQAVKGGSARCIKRWLKSATKTLLADSKFASLMQHPTLKRFSASEAAGKFPVPSLQSILTTAVNGVHDQEAFQSRLQTEKLAALKQLAYGASHEINNPLANIATGAQALMQSEPDDDRRLRLANIYQQSMAAHEMICDLMLFAHPPAPVMEAVDLRAMISEIINRARQQGRIVKVTFGPGVCEAHIDRTQMMIAIEALLRNAFEAVDQVDDPDCQGEVSIRIDVANDQSRPCLRLFVVDNGPGFTQQQARHMFDPFYSGREAGRGLGFGLSKTYRIVKLHNGEILADRDRRAGETTFLIRLPL